LLRCVIIGRGYLSQCYNTGTEVRIRVGCLGRCLGANVLHFGHYRFVSFRDRHDATDIIIVQFSIPASRLTSAHAELGQPGHFSRPMIFFGTQTRVLTHRVEYKWHLQNLCESRLVDLKKKTAYVFARP